MSREIPAPAERTRFWTGCTPRKPGEPHQNAYVERFNRNFREEILAHKGTWLIDPSIRPPHKANSAFN
ncbi:integrase core domain-containing protein [Dyella thiooxydans]|uniref:integrase core domain-containing protein n=1 Tax=Dyella thiooxydans TaxID=445710 RepID=UPI000A03E831